MSILSVIDRFINADLYSCPTGNEKFNLRCFPS